VKDEKIKRKSNSLGTFVGLEQNKVQQAEQFNVTFIIDEKDIQNFEFPCQEYSKHQEIVTIDHKNVQ